MGENGKEANGGESELEVKENGGVGRNGTLEVDGGRESKVVRKREEEDASSSNGENKHLGWKVMPFIIGNETFEKLGAIGTLANLLIYLTTVFNMENVEAATIINVFNGTCNLGTLFGAYLSDSFFGRYKTLGFATVTSFLGLLMIDLTATVSKLHPSHCGKESKTCDGATPGQLAFLYAGFGLMVIGAGGVRPCNLAFGADQFNPKTESGKKGIASFFNWYFFTFTFAELVSLTLIVYVQSNVSWAIGLGIPAALMFIACVLYFVGSKLYVKVKATGSPMTSVVQVFTVAIKKRSLQALEQPGLSLFKYIPPESINVRLPYTGQFRFLDKAAIRTAQDQINSDGSPADPWKLCSMQQVEEVKCLLKVIPIWIAAVLFTVPIAQQMTYSVFQATQCDRRLGSSNFKIPAASYTVFQMLGLTIFIPIYDRALVPLFRRLTGQVQGITLLQRIGVGIFLSALSVIVSGLVENRRRTIALTRPTLGVVPRKGAISSMSALWLAPQLLIAGLSEAFGSVGLMEFYYRQFPENMRTIAGSLFYCGLAGSNYLSSLIISIVHRATRGDSDWLGEDLNKGRLDYFYYMIAALGILDLGYFLMCSKWYQYKRDEDPEIKEESKISEKNMADC